MKKITILYFTLAMSMSLYAQQVAVSYEIDHLSDQEASIQIYLQSLTEQEQPIRAINLSLVMPEGCLSVVSHENIFADAWTDYLQEVQQSQGLELTYQNQPFSQRWQYGCADPGLPGTSLVVIPAQGEAPLLAMTMRLEGSCLDHFYLEHQDENPVNQMGDEIVNPIDWTIFRPATEIEFSEEQSIHVYPNPVKDWLHMSFEGSIEEVMEVKLLSQEGKIIWEKQLHPLEIPFNRFNLQHLPAAVYVLQIKSMQSTENTSMIKILKQ